MRFTLAVFIFLATIACSTTAEDLRTQPKRATTAESAATAPQTEEAINATFTVIGTGAAPLEDLGTIRVAETDAELADLMGSIEPSDTKGELDPADVVFVMLTVPDGLCDRPQTVVRFDASSPATLTPVLDMSPRSCRLALRPRAILLAIERATLNGPTTVRLPANDIYGYEEGRALIIPDH